MEAFPTAKVTEYATSQRTTLSRVSARANVRLRRVTRSAVIAATGASALVGVVVAKEVPGGSGNTSSTKGTPAAVTPTIVRDLDHLDVIVNRVRPRAVPPPNAHDHDHHRPAVTSGGTSR